MILPIALAKGTPLERFQTGNYISDVKASARAALNFYYEIEKLKKELIEHVDNKLAAAHNKKVRTTIKQLDSDMSRVIKHSDYTVMTTVAFENSKIIPYQQFDELKETTTDPILVRGIAAGKIIDYVKAKGQDYYFIETGYFGNYMCEGNTSARKFWHRIVKNEMQHTKVIDVPDDRWSAMCKYDSRLEWNGWKKSGSKILIVAPSEKPCKYYGIDKDEWIANTVKQLKKYTDRDIVVREKADRTERTSGKVIYEAFDEDIFAVVTYNSIAAAEAVAYGIPAFALAPTAATPVCLDDLSKIETPYYPDYDFVRKWLSSLAYGQFNLAEILTGTAWKMVLENEQRPTISY
jgi:hypothetical protein